MGPFLWVYFFQWAFIWAEAQLLQRVQWALLMTQKTRSSLTNENQHVIKLNIKVQS